VFGRKSTSEVISATRRQHLDQRIISAMTIFLLLVLLALVVAGLTGWGVADTRDARYTLWPPTGPGGSPSVPPGDPRP